MDRMTSCCAQSIEWLSTSTGARSSVGAQHQGNQCKRPKGLMAILASSLQPTKHGSRRSSLPEPRTTTPAASPSLPAMEMLYGIVALLVLANTINIAADVAAMGEALRLLVGGRAHWHVVFFGLLSVLLQVSPIAVRAIPEARRVAPLGSRPAWPWLPSGHQSGVTIGP